jgi:alpha-glucosidase
MPWVAAAPAAGFSTGKPWLPADPAHRALAVDLQQDDAGSTLNLTRRVLALRRRHAALRLGHFETLSADETLLVLQRQHEDDTVLVAFNLGTAQATHELRHVPKPAGEALALNGARLDGRCLHLPPGAAFLLPTRALAGPGAAQR